VFLILLVKCTRTWEPDIFNTDEISTFLKTAAADPGVSKGSMEPPLTLNKIAK